MKAYFSKLKSHKMVLCILTVLVLGAAQVLKAQQTFYNQIAIFVELADTKFNYPIQQSIERLNGVNETSISFDNYFKLASAGKVNFKTYFPMEGDDVYIVKLPWTWEDITSEFGVYDDRKISKAAIEAIVDKLPTDVNFDMDEDGYIDAISFYVACNCIRPGEDNRCASMMFNFATNLKNSGIPDINGKKVGYSAWNSWSAMGGIIKEDKLQYDLGTAVHETIHTFGPLDYYYLWNNTGTLCIPVGSWDVMDDGNGAPASLPSAYIRGKLGWIDIPEITDEGEYTLYPATSGRKDSVAYKICTNADPTQKEYIVVEYRYKGDESTFSYNHLYQYGNLNAFDGLIYGSGLVIYKVNTNFNSNAGAAYAYVSGGNQTQAHLLAESELISFRSGGTPTSFGDFRESFFSADVERSSFTPNTDPYPFLADGTKIEDIYITNISSAGETISFNFSRTFIPAGIDNTLKNNISIYPNPAKDELRIENGEIQINRLEILDLSGKVVCQYDDSKNKINISTLSRGIYFVKIETDNGVVTRKFVKE